MARTAQQQIKYFLKTGHSDPLPEGWPGENWLERAQNADRAMRQALIEEVKERSKGLPVPAAPVLDYLTFARSKVAPMVNGLFPEHERANILEMLEKSVECWRARALEKVH